MLFPANTLSGMPENNHKQFQKILLKLEIQKQEDVDAVYRYY